MGLLTYSGITTKVRAMESRLLTPQQFQEMASLEDVRSAADYLKQQPAYADIFSGLDDTRLHRGYIEQLLAYSEYQDFSRLYRFSNLSQRRFLDLYFMHYEITIIKRILHNVMGGIRQQTDLSVFQTFFDRHSSIDLIKLAQAESTEEFVTGLEGSYYHDLIYNLSSQKVSSLSDYEVCLDLLYFKTMWKITAQMLTGKEREIVRQCFGSRLDLLNVQWIYRSKKYYQLSAADIYTLLIPVRYKLKAEQIQQMAESSSLEEFFSAIKSTHYGKISESEWNGQPDPESLYHQTLNRVYSSAGRRHPYTVAILDSYLYAKELEIHKIIATIEGIRYGLSPDEITAMVKKQ
jgi:Archaeal/vacuolar-type H+-ATPase subunit C